MKHSELRSTRLIRHWLAAILICASVASPRITDAQQITPLIQFTNVWKYDRSGLELGAAWRTNDFDDAAWESGRGLLGFEDALAPYLIHVPSGLGTIIPLSGSVTTFYFRATFQFTGTTSSVQLFATNLVDDGCAIWLNGRLAGGVRMVPNFIATTTFSPPVIEGQLDTVALTNFLRVGENQLAVEVHQSSATSADMLFGMKLLAFTPTPLVITNQPQDAIVAVGDTATLRVGVSGGPVSYRWQREGVMLLSTSNTLVIANAQLANSGVYQVICSNALGTVTSLVARLDVFADLAGPQGLAAIVDNGFGANRLNVLFSELLTNGAPTAPSSPRNIANYQLTRLGTTNTIPLTNVAHSGSQTLLFLDTNRPNWVPYGDYVLTINNVADRFGNSIAPDTQLPVLWNHTTNLVHASHEWQFHNSSVFDPGVYEEDWTTCDYQPGPWWGSGVAPFYGAVSPSSPCTDLGSPLTPLGWQPEPMLFRTTFDYPAHWPATARLRLSMSIDDGLVLYLNGVEIYRNNASTTAGVPVGLSSRAAATINISTCITNSSITVTNLLPGTNCFAVALLQPAQGDNDLYFVLKADATVQLGPQLPATPPPDLSATPVSADNLRLSWTSGGYVLESSTNLDAGPLSYPYGPWTPVPQLANPYHWPLTNGEARYFRLKK